MSIIYATHKLQSQASCIELVNKEYTYLGNPIASVISNVKNDKGISSLPIKTIPRCDKWLKHEVPRTITMIQICNPNNYIISHMSPRSSQIIWTWTSKKEPYNEERKIIDHSLKFDSPLNFLLFETLILICS